MAAGRAHGCVSVVLHRTPVSQAQSHTPPPSLHVALLSAVLLGGWFALAPLADGWFWGSDDWLHLEHARVFAEGHPLQAFWLRIFDYHGSGQAALRQTSTAVWGLDYLLFGASARAYYVTNIAIHLLNAALAYALAWRLGRSVWAAAVCASLYVLNARTTEVIWFLAVRSEALALTFGLLTVLVWTRTERGARERVGAALLFALALFAKTTAGFLPLVLLASDVATLPRRRWLHPLRMLRDYGLGVVALGLYGGAVLGWLDLGTTLGYVPDATRTLATEAGIVLNEARSALLTPHWTASYGPVTVPPAAEWRQWMIVATLALGAAAWRGPRSLWLVGAAFLVGGMVLPWGLLARGLGFGRYFLPSSLGLGLLVGAAVVAFEGRGWSRWPGRALGLSLVAVSAMAFHNPDGIRFHADLGRGVQSAMQALRASVDASGPIRDLYLVLPSSQRGMTELVQREKTLEILLGGAAPERVLVLAEGTEGLRAERPQRGGPRGGVPHCGDLLPLRWDFELDSVDYAAGDRVLYLAAGPAGGTAKHPTFAVLDRPPPAVGEGEEPFAGPTRALWVLSSPDAASAWSHSGFDGQSQRERLPHLDPHGVRLATGAPIFGQTLQQTLLNHRPGVLVSPALDFATEDLCELRIDLRVQPLGAGGRPFECALEPARFALLFWSDAPELDALHRRHMVLPLRADGRTETLRVNLRNSPPWMNADRLRRLALAPSSTPADVTLQRVELVGCGFGGTE